MGWSRVPYRPATKGRDFLPDDVTVQTINKGKRLRFSIGPAKLQEFGLKIGESVHLDRGTGNDASLARMSKTVNGEAGRKLREWGSPLRSHWAKVEVSANVWCPGTDLPDVEECECEARANQRGEVVVTLPKALRGLGDGDE